MPNRTSKDKKRRKKAGGERQEINRAGAARSPARATKKPKAGPTQPSSPTVKRLFALSGNTCAFPKCTTPIIDKSSGSVLGEICHIKGDKIGSPRYDASQSNAERQSFDNLILLCAQHHKVVDDDVKSYSVDRLMEMKAAHKPPVGKREQLNRSQVARLIASARGNAIAGGSVIQSQRQTGGQVAHLINNYNESKQPDDRLRLEGKLSIAGDMNLLRVFGGPGLKILVANKGRRTAKIRHLVICAEDPQALRAFQEGFGSDFGYVPPKKEEDRWASFCMKFFSISPNKQFDGYSLERDDVCTFYLPIVAGIGVFANAPPDKVEINAVTFDEREITLIRGPEVCQSIKSLIEAHGKSPWPCRVPVEIFLKVRSASAPDTDPLIGTTNPNPVSFTESPSSSASVGLKLRVALGIAENSQAQQTTIGLLVSEVPPNIVNELSAVFIADEIVGRREMPFTQIESMAANECRFLLPFVCFDELRKLVTTLAPEQFGIVVRVSKYDFLRVAGPNVKDVIESRTQSRLGK